jgi:hypothetical protein
LTHSQHTHASGLGVGVFVGVLVGVLVGVCDGVSEIVGVTVGVLVGVLVGVWDGVSEIPGVDDIEIVGVRVGVFVGVCVMVGVGVGVSDGSMHAPLVVHPDAPWVNEKCAEFGCVGEHTVVEYPGWTITEVPESPLSGQIVYENVRSTPVMFCAM